MSYAFSIVAADKRCAKERVAEELGKVVEQQSVHSRDREQAQAAADAFIDLLPDGDDRHVRVVMNGSVMTAHDVTYGVSVNVFVGMVDKE